MHHSSEALPDGIRKLLDDGAIRPAPKLGETGRFPEGKLCDNDEGEIVFSVGSDKEAGKVILDFGEKPIAYIGMNAQQAVDLAQCLIQHARTVAKETLTLEIP